MIQSHLRHVCVALSPDDKPEVEFLKGNFKANLFLVFLIFFILKAMTKCKRLMQI